MISDIIIIHTGASQVALVVKNQPASVRDAKKPGFDPYVGKIPWRRKMATHSSVLAWTVPQTRGAWRATVHRVTKSWTQLSDI